MLTLANASIGYGRRALISCVDLTFQRGEAVFLSGPNGSGKSTLAKSLIGAMPLVAGVRSSKFAALAYVPQSSHFDVQYPVTVRGLIRQGLKARYQFKTLFRPAAYREAERVAATLKSVGLDSIPGALLREISGGQLQRALIGRALIGEPDFLLLDEPFSNLDRSGRGEITRILREFANPQRTICVIDHADAIERDFYSRFLEIDTGHIMERGA